MTFRCLWSNKIGSDQHRCKEQCLTCAIYAKDRMTFDDYTFEARRTAIYPRERAIEYLVLGLNGEAGEVAEGLKRLIQHGATFNPLLELGDVLWYVAMIADEFGYSLAEVAEKNLKKPRDPQDRDALHGSGDER